MTLPDERTDEPIRPDASHAAQFRLTTLLMAITLICVFLALWASAPGLAMSAAIFGFPAFIRTAIVARRRAEIGRPMSVVGKLTGFVGSLIVANVIANVVLVASFGTFCLVCVGGMGANMNESVALIMAGAASLVMTFVVGKVMYGWVRRRYRRDTLADDSAGRPVGRK